jgi:hypothetical protein
MVRGLRDDGPGLAHSYWQDLEPGILRRGRPGPNVRSTAGAYLITGSNTAAFFVEPSLCLKKSHR